MIDFTMSAYRNYLEAIKGRYPIVLTFAEYFTAQVIPDSFCLIRHDVDRKPTNALAMGRLEYALGIRASYYFRSRSHTLRPRVIRELANLGHEIGYHYECLSEANGDMEKALSAFSRDLARLREICEVKTVAMHGAPFSPFDNLDIFREPANHAFLKNELGLLGEIYLDLDYRKIAYITDTGRNWSSQRHNRRDKVRTEIELNISDGQMLLELFRRGEQAKVVFQVHPERWNSSPGAFVLQAGKDYIINMVKRFLDWKIKR